MLEVTDIGKYGMELGTTVKMLCYRPGETFITKV